jgi:hypothetical protein
MVVPGRVGLLGYVEPRLGQTAREVQNCTSELHISADGAMGERPAGGLE